ncbi:enoyl-CoA hydratase/isomerase family protein [Bacillus dakarensis]|uniref:enoyl-CoA hydratase/isomerase family protein n=1 Tax=Robertmurraya dakarensis TaxID=1926278 RepID=UPI000981410B|nr:enoyl-CoA hydratase-related protein [Bacillus dakarensis]
MVNNLISEEWVRVNTVNEIATVIINRENKLNALNSELVTALIGKLKELEEDESVRGIILTGVGRSFIVGADISEMKELNTASAINFITRLHQLINTIRQLKKPVIAAVNGYCFGAGLELAVACDLLIASEEASFGMQEVQIGIPSVIEAALLPFIIGVAKTRELLLTGEVINSKVASEIGLVNHIVSHETLMERTEEYAQKITKNAPHAVMLQKQLINRWLENAGVDQSIKNGIDSFGIAFSYPEASQELKNALGGGEK